MRKSNSIFKTAFVSEAGGEIANNDYFAFVEDDDFACYVLAAGITDFETSEAAKEVVEHLILSFEEKPSMSKTTLLKYMEETNERLLSGSHAHRLKASVIMVVTDYEKFRYVAAGNVRLRMYRQGRFFLNSSDMSLANDLIQKGESETPLAKHEERHNLYTYLGKKDFFKPFVSKVQKLADADIITLYSRGLWEHVDEQEMDEIFAEATDNPQESVDMLEEILLSRQPQDLKSYTAAAIFVNKIFRDPDRERKRLFYMKVAAVVLVILIIVGIVFYIFYRIRESKMEKYLSITQEAISLRERENFKRARESAREALILARELDIPQDEKMIEEILEILDNIVQGDDFFISENYHAAHDNYLKALQHSDTNDKKVYVYIQRRLNSIENALEMDQFMALGEYLFQNGEYDEAESLYLKANKIAATIHNNAVRQKITDSLEKIYDKRAELQKESEQKLSSKRQTAINDALKKGDELLEAGDYAGAEKAYNDARSIARDLAEIIQTTEALNKVSTAKNKKAEDITQAAVNDALQKGDDLLRAGDIDGAQKAYLNARILSNSPEVRQQTNDALQKVSDAREKKIVEARTTDDERKRLLDFAANAEKKGDEAFANGDYDSAQVHYMLAISQLIDLAEDVKLEIVQNKYYSARVKSSEAFTQKRNAEQAEADARTLYVDKNFEAAKAKAVQAKELYTELGLKSKVTEMDVLIQQISVDSVISNAVK